MELHEKRFKVLIADDDAINRKLLRKILEREYEINLAENGKQALDSIKNDTPDIVLMDILMPEMNGYEVASYIQTQQEYVDIPILALSSLQEGEDIIDAFLAGCVDFIRKPFIAEEVLVRIAVHLRLHNKFKLHQKENKQ